MELKKQCLEAFEAVGTITLTQEETAETIVPDYCPDIARIVRTDGRIYLHSRQMRDGKAEISGTVRIGVLYTPDGEKGLRTLEFAMPFTVESDRGSFPQCRSLNAEAELAALETRLLNPRKVFTRCKLLCRVTGYQKTQLLFGTDLEAEEKLCVEKKLSSQKIVFLKSISEKDFSFTDDIGISQGREGAAELLSGNIHPVVTETKTVGNKLIVKGCFRIGILYRDTAGKCTSFETELPFSQVMETETGTEDVSADVRVQLTGADLQISGDDPEGHQITVTLYLHAAALLYQEQEITILEDLYSTAYNTSYDAAALELTSFREGMQRRQTVREVLEVGVVAESVLSIGAQCGAVTAGKEGRNTVLRTPVTIRALYLDEGGAVLCAERAIEVSCYLELPEDCRVSAEAFCAGEMQGSIGERGIEVRFPVDFSVRTEGKVRRVCISAVRLDREEPKDIVSAPSLVLRCLNRQEKLWDLAKRYHTTVEAILSANGLESEGEIPYDKLLLIPKKRA